MNSVFYIQFITFFMHVVQGVFLRDLIVSVNT